MAPMVPDCIDRRRIFSGVSVAVLMILRSGRCELVGEGVVGPLQRLSAVLGRPHVAGTRMSLEQFDTRRTPAQLTEECARVGVCDFLIRDSPQVLADPEAAGVTGGAASGQNVVRTNHL